MRYWVILLVVLGVGFAGCKKEKITFQPYPVIRLVNTYPTLLVEFSSIVLFTLEYEDGDGDIGFEDADEYTIVLQDARLTEPDLYYVKPLAPLGSSVPIKGVLEIKLNSLFLLGSGAVTESTTFNIRLVDRAGNWSNIVTSPTITISP